MGEGNEHHHQHHHHRDLLLQQPRPTGRHVGVKGGGGSGGEIVEVQGGHIVRSTGRKDRHSKVCTAKGPRDRRVRLSAHTAIQFYDVQDRLGYDRPSKAVDWLIKNAKAAIDELAELPPWLPTATIASAADPTPVDTSAGNKTMQIGEPSGYGFGGSPSFLPPSLESDAIADTIKFFFPVASTVATSASSVGFQDYPPDLLSRSNSHVQDLRLSLQSFQDPILLQHHHQQQRPPQSSPGAGEQVFFEMNSSNWAEQQARVSGWGGGDGGFVFNVPQSQGVALHPMGGHSSPFHAQRGPLQSNNSPSVLAWTDPVAAMQAAAVARSATGFASGGFSGFRIPARIQGEEEHDGGVADKPPEAPPR